MKKQDTFRIGISMAGAVSAGAYTAGVMDYLIETLENWQKAKELHLPGIPIHNVVIEVVSGASAGGMTAVITAAAIQKPFPHVGQHNYQTPDASENPFFNSWVNLTEKHNKDMMSQLLDDKDITHSPEHNPHQEVRSVFNSSFIEIIAGSILENTLNDPSSDRPYFAGDLEILTTITNLRGFNYGPEFITASGIQNDRMTMHKDLIHLQLNPSGTYRDDGKIPFHFESAIGLNKNLLADAAIATGAFPFGLAPRLFVRDPKYINDNLLLKKPIGLQWLADPSADYCTIAVDGGIFNNEPYDLTDKALNNRIQERKEDQSNKYCTQNYRPETSASQFDSTVLMIDPFPGFMDISSPVIINNQALKFTSIQLVGAMEQQLLVKEDLLKRAIDEKDFSRFLVAPIRTARGRRANNDLACGSVSGFGGFFSRKFRIHDYMLGRRNCQRFLQEYFCVPTEADNPIIITGYEHLQEADMRMFLSSDRKSLPIIPDIRISEGGNILVRPGVEMEFSYPSIEPKYLLQLERKVKSRLEAVLKNLNNSSDPMEKSIQANATILRIRKKTLFMKYFYGPARDFAKDLIIAVVKKTGKDLVARKFIDAVMIDLDEKGLLSREQ